MACDIDDREGESPSPMEPRLGRTFHSSATGRRRQHTIPEALGLCQAGRAVVAEVVDGDVGGLDGELVECLGQFSRRRFSQTPHCCRQTRGTAGSRRGVWPGGRRSRQRRRATGRSGRRCARACRRPTRDRPEPPLSERSCRPRMCTPRRSDHAQRSGPGRPGKSSPNAWNDHAEGATITTAAPPTKRRLGPVADHRDRAGMGTRRRYRHGRHCLSHIAHRRPSHTRPRPL
jgi:hypothetical protein